MEARSEPELLLMLGLLDGIFRCDPFYQAFMDIPACRAGARKVVLGQHFRLSEFHLLPHFTRLPSAEVSLPSHI